MLEAVRLFAGTHDINGAERTWSAEGPLWQALTRSGLWRPVAEVEELEDGEYLAVKQIAPGDSARFLEAWTECPPNRLSELTSLGCALELEDAVGRHSESMRQALLIAAELSEVPPGLREAKDLMVLALGRNPLKRFSVDSLPSSLRVLGLAACPLGPKALTSLDSLSMLRCLSIQHIDDLRSVLAGAPTMPLTELLLTDGAPEVLREVVRVAPAAESLVLSGAVLCRHSVSILSALPLRYLALPGARLPQEDGWWSELARIQVLAVDPGLAQQRWAEHLRERGVRVVTTAGAAF